MAVPSLTYYCGLSGILNGLLALGLLRLWRDIRHPLILITGLGAVIKIIWETALGSALLTSTAWPSLPEVHGVGFVCGLLFAAFVLLLKRREAGRLRLVSGADSVRQAAPYR
jgi:hypothetical protein